MYLKLHGNIECISPLRAKTYLSQEKKIADSYENIPLSSSKGITTRDRWDVSRCDLLLVNMLQDQRYIGTIMEIAWADLLRKPIILCMKEESPYNHAMIRECAGFIVPTIQEACDLTIALLG